MLDAKFKSKEKYSKNLIIEKVVQILLHVLTTLLDAEPYGMAQAIRTFVNFVKPKATLIVDLYKKS